MPEPSLDTFDQAAALHTLTHAPPAAVKALAESLLPDLHPLEVIENRTGLVILPYRDTVEGTLFHLGEVLVAEARVRRGEVDGYGAVLGRDLEFALAVALCDLAGQTGIGGERLEGFLRAARAEQIEADTALYQRVEATRVQMETF